jgi:hypothetical protein
MRSGPEVDRTQKFLGSAYLPALKRAGAKSIGLFSSVVAERTPFILCFSAYASLSAFESAEDRLSADGDMQKAATAYNAEGDSGYIRIEAELLRAFPRIGEVSAPPSDPKHAPRIFELRTYESPSEAAGRRKIEMFENGEAGIFRRLGMAPVFFGQSLAAANLPSLTYMLSFDDLASRERLWKTFGADPEWQTLRAQPGLSDAEIVSNISNEILRPLPLSEIR